MGCYSLNKLLKFSAVKNGHYTTVYLIYHCFQAFIRRIAMSPTSMPLGPRPLIFCGPSGSGKSTLIKHLMSEFTDKFGFSVSHTTRSPRPGEVEGQDYHYVSREEMEQGIANGDFIESATYSGNMYGTSKNAVLDVQRSNRICILDIDTQGVKLIKKTKLDPILIFKTSFDGSSRREIAGQKH